MKQQAARGEIQRNTHNNDRAMHSQTFIGYCQSLNIRKCKLSLCCKYAQDIGDHEKQLGGVVMNN